MKPKPIERVKEIIDSDGLSISGFEKKTGLSNNSIQTAIKRNSNLKDETLNTILNSFPEVDAEWLLTGKGEMFKKEGENEKMMKTEADPKDQYIIELQRDKIKNLENEVQRLKKANEPQPGYRHAAEPE